MSKNKEPLKRQVAIDNLTKHKFMGQKVKVDDGKLTLKSKSNSSNSLTQRLINKTLIIDDQSPQLKFEVVQEKLQLVEKLYILGNVNNVREIDEEVKKHYQISQRGIIFEVNQYIILLLGRQQMKIKNGTQIGLYVPPAFKSAKCIKTGKISIVIQRKLKNNCYDPLQYPYFVIEPNQCLYPTYLVSWIQCKRRITIQHYVEYDNQINESMVFGNVIHKYCEWLVKKEVDHKIPTEAEMRKLYNEFLYQMFLIDASFDMFLQKCDTGIGNLVDWYNRFVLKGETIELNKYDKKYLKINKTIGSEVMMKSKYFGIKGKVDALFKGIFTDEKNNLKYEVYVPFELKTGEKARDSHRKQVDIYLMLTRQQKNTSVVGLLYYSETNKLQSRFQNPLSCYENINIRRNQIITNNLNLYQSSEEIIFPSLPEAFDKCKFCNRAIQCGVNLLEKPIKDIEESPINTNLSDQIGQSLQKLSNSQFAYVKKWMKLLHLEECEVKEMEKSNKVNEKVDNFYMEPNELQNFIFEETADESIRLKIFHKYENFTELQTLQTIYKIGQKVRIHIPLIQLTENCKILRIEKKEKVLKIKVQIFNGQVRWSSYKLFESKKKKQLIEVILQKYGNNFYSNLRGIAYEFALSSEKWLKKLIIDNEYQKVEDCNEIMVDSKMTSDLNENQEEAFIRCVKEDRFCLVQGMPGTGKTQLILRLIEQFYEQGKTILVTSFTNQSLLNIILRQTTKQKKIPQEHLIREGSRYGFTECIEYLTHRSQKYESINDYKEYFKNKRVWFVTMNSLFINHLPEMFDVVIVDEASQCLEPICLKALMKAKKFILIGDAKQLQPVVKSNRAIELEMQKSLFQRLSDNFPFQKVSLKKQYRMNEKIMNLSNELVYEGKLELATPEMKNRRLEISQEWNSEQTPPYIRVIVNPEKPLRFVNYDGVLGLFVEDSKKQNKVRRYLQIKITCMIYEAFRKAGIKRQDILIISVFNSSVHEIVSGLVKRELIKSNEGDVLTIDKSQGSDKEVIIFLFHKGNKELIENPRRLNVALTRAKNKFIIIGSMKYINDLGIWTGKLASLLKDDQIEIQQQFVEGILEQ